MGRLIQRSGDTVYRLLNPALISMQVSGEIAQSMFMRKKRLYLVIDDTLIKKISSKVMQGSGMFYDTKLAKCIIAFRLVVGIITDGHFTVPLGCSYLFAKELIDTLVKQQFPSKEDIAQSLIKTAQKLFPHPVITVVVDGLYSTVSFLTWCKTNAIRLEARMHSNRIVEYDGKRIKLRDLLTIKGMRPTGRRMARTISVKWHGIDLELTMVRRLDKEQKESFVFQIATYQALPREHVAAYKKRWAVEMMFRTTKQSLGLQECFSRELETQHNHVAAVLLAYSLAQLDMKQSRLKTPEQAIRRCKTKNASSLNHRFIRILQDIPSFHA